MIKPSAVYASVFILLFLMLGACIQKEAVTEQDNFGSQSVSGDLKENGSSESSGSEVDLNKIIDNMTLYEKICQLLIISPESLTGTGIVTQAGENTKNALAKLPVGGIIYSKPNLESKQQVKTMLKNIQSFSEIPLILTCDEEGGRVNRLMSTVGTTYIGPMLEYKDKGSSVAYDNAFTIAADMKALGFNADMAPVADVWSNPDNTVIGDRAYSDDFDQAAELVASAVRGFRSGGVATALKHFPGHGDTFSDSHNGSVSVGKKLDELRKNELLPFKAGIEAGSDMVMIGHLTVPDIDDKPATFSYKIISELLRRELEFDGVVITDSLQMKAVTDYYTSGEAAVNAILAGADLLLCPEEPFEAVSSLEKAVKADVISESRIDESVLRILKMKKENGLFDS